MTTQSRNARIGFYSGLAVLVSAVILLASCPGAGRWFGTTLTRSGVSTRANLADVPARRATDSNSPLRFEENQGQTAREVRFVSHGGGYELFLTPQEAVLALHPARRLDLSPTHRTAYFKAQREARKATKTAVLRMRLANSNKATRIAGIDSLPGRVDYFLGQDPSNWRTNIPSYARVKYADVYPGVDLVFYGNQRRLEYDFIVAPGADPKAIALNVEGSRKLRVNSRGDLLVTVSGGEVQFQKPLVYQQIGGERREIAGNYAITGNHQVTFAVAKYDSTKPLVVDPVLIYSTYLGGELDDTGQAIAVDSLGDAVVTGTTLSLQFPTTAGAFTPSPLASNANGVVFVTKMNPAGTSLLYSSYVGGSGGDSGLGVALDGSGNIYVTGESFSTDFPTTANALKPGPNAGNANGTSFVFKINPALSGASSLVYSSYLGGTQSTVTEFGNAVATDANGLVYIVGLTASQPGAALANFPVTASTAFQATPDPANTTGTGFLTKLDTTKTGAASLIYSSYLGGNGVYAGTTLGPGFGDAAFGVAEDSTGNTYVAGTTASSNFPTTTTAFQQTRSAGNTASTAFVSRFDTTKVGAASLLYSTYLGGDTADFGGAIALGPSNVAYVTGSTSSLLFPATSGAFQTTGNAQGISFITLVDASLTGSASLKYSTFVGGSQTNSAFGIATDTAGNAYIVGATQGSDFPVTKGAFQAGPVAGSQGEGFVTKLNPAGTGAADLVYSTYFGGSGNGPIFDEVNAIAVNPLTNNGYITGATSSTAATFPVFPNPGAFQTALKGPSDAFISQLTFQPTLTVSPLTLTFGPQLVGTPTAAQMVTLTNSNITAVAFTSIAVSGGSPAAANTDFTSPSNTCGSSIAAGASCTISVVFTPSVAAVETANLVITDGDSTSPQSVTLTGTGTSTAASFALSASPTTLTVAQGASGTFKVTVTPAGGFNQAVTLACSGLPANSTCTVAPTSVTPSDGVTPVSAMVTVATTSPAVVTPPTSTPDTRMFLWRTVPLFSALSLLLFLARRQRLAIRLGMVAAMTGFLALAGCGGGHTPTGGTPKGTSTVTVTGTSGTLTSSATVTLTVN